MSKDVSYYGGVIGRELTVDTPRASYIDDGLIAFDERVQTARQHWPQGKSSDFEQLDRRRYRDVATGRVYRHERGCGPLLNPTIEALDCWFVKDGKLVLLVRDERSETTATVVHGPIRGGVVEDGQVRWSS
jgi:hypothetical protein